MALAHEEVQELLGVFALDAVEGDEAVEIERHFGTCPRCRAELAAHREVTSMFAWSGQEAPVGLWDRITSGMQEEPPPLRLDRIRPGLAVEPPVMPVMSVRRAGVAGRPPGPAAQGGATPTGLPVPIDRARPWARSRPAPGRRGRVVRGVAAVAAAVAIVVLGLQVALARPGRTHHAETTGLTMVVVRAALHAPGSRTMVLRSPGTAPGSAGAVVRAVIEPSGTAYLYDASLTPLPDDRTYQLWGVVGGRRISYGLLGTHPGIVEFHGGSGLAALAVTDEVASGVVASHQPFTVVGTLSPPL